MKYIKDFNKNIDFDTENTLLELPENDLDYIVTTAINNNGDLYDYFYTSKYTSNVPSVNSTAQKYFKDMEKAIELTNGNIYSKQQSNSPSYYYTWINNGTNNDKNRYRIYLAPNPEQMHILAKTFAYHAYKNNLNLEYKIQMPSTDKYKKNDRIIVYCTTKEILQKCFDIFNDIQQQHPEYFYNSEKSPIWYNSPVKNVYFSPEIIQKDESYGGIFSKSISETKHLLSFYCNCKDIKQYHNSLTSYEKEKLYDFNKTLLRSVLLKNSCCIKKNFDLMYKNIIPTYFIATNGKLINRCNNYNKDGKIDVAIINQNDEGKRFVTQNFYTLPTMLPYNPEVLTKEVSYDEFFNMIIEYDLSK